MTARVTSIFTLAVFWTTHLIDPVSAANCSAITCYNGGTCNNHTASPPCLCPLPYIAPYCIAAVNYCSALQPDKNITTLPVCFNGGNCTMMYSDPYFNCTCPPGYSGRRCETTNNAILGNKDDTPRNLAAGSIAGITIGIFAFVVLIIILVVLLTRKKNMSESGSTSRSNGNAPLSARKYQRGQDNPAVETNETDGANGTNVTNRANQPVTTEVIET